MAAKKPKKKSNAGRKGKYNPNTFPLLAEGFAREGLSDKQICKKLGISQDTFYTYIKKHSEFSESLKRGKAPVDTKVENALLKKALGYTVEKKKTTVTNGMETVTIEEVIVAPSEVAMIFWLKNRRPKQWRDKQDVEHSGEIETVLKININPAKKQD